MSARYAYVYFLQDDPERVRAVVARHVAHCRGLQLPGYLGGPFADRSGGRIIFQAESEEQAQQAVATDPFLQEGLLAAHWFKQCP